MKGMYRKIDQLGRIMLPVKIRRSFGLKPGSEVDIEAGSIGIMLSPRNVQRCEFCAGTADLLTVEGATLCRGCETRLAEAAKAAICKYFEQKLAKDVEIGNVVVMM